MNQVAVGRISDILNSTPFVGTKNCGGEKAQKRGEAEVDGNEIVDPSIFC